MSPITTFVLAACFAMEASSIRTAPKPVISLQQYQEAALVLQGLLNDTLCLYSSKIQKQNLLQKNSTTNQTTNPHILGDGTPLPLGKMNWEVEDFNPEALKRGPCGIKTETPERVGKGGGLTTPQEKLVKALKLWIVELQKGTDGDNAKACEKLDGDKDKKIDEAE